MAKTHLSFHSHSSSSRHDELSRHVKVSVWWDFENCSPPASFNAFKISDIITSAVRANGIKGPVQITAFGDIFKLSRTNQEELSATGVNISLVPNGGKNSADRSLLVDLLCWVSQNPPPAHLFLITGGRDFASVLHRLRMNNYNVLLATSESAPSVLRIAASIMWNWNELLKGENLTGKHYNQPPDGPYGSWYGHYRVALEDPFLVEQPACTRTEELSESCSESVPRPVPEAVIKQIRQILNSYPKGISIIDLRAELKKSNVGLDKDLYGYKKFSRFLLSMPHILKLQPEDELTVSSMSSSDDRTEYVVLNEKSRLHHSPEVNAGVTPGKIQQTSPENGNLVKVNAGMLQEEAQQPLPVDQKIAKASNDQIPERSLQDRILEQDSASDGSLIKKVCQRWFGGSDFNRAGKGHNLPGKQGDSADSSEKQNNSTLTKCTGVGYEREGMKEELEKKSCEVPYTVISSSSSNDSTVDTKATYEAIESHSGKRSVFFNWIAG
ncbi:uncharacterized protein LOC120129438 [Hibiscus syriacus]|uniref:uncharacterized protein LOC120129438 n=1 Tax=Hibiscus syriacus TaxID=106335 RepID=UPI001921D946|nr:uncharacterized protein LOC120129438 [Hibiscus syriacus]